MKKFYSISNILNLSFALVALAGAINAVAGDSLPFYDSPEFTPRWIAPNTPQLDGLHQIPEFSFVDQDGQTITEETFSNRIYVANFFFTTCPGICPMIRSKLSKVQDQFLDDDRVSIVSHSIRPTTDTMSILQEYAKKHGVVSGKWHLLTGDKNAIYKLARSAYFANEDLGSIQKTNDFLHTENVLLIDNNRHIRGIYNGLNSTSMNHLIDDIATLKAELAGEVPAS